MARRACLAIGVSTVTPPKGEPKVFGDLDGAVVAARTIGRWALSSGFGEANVQVVTDERVGGKAQPVTRERVQRAVDALFPAQADTVEHMILSFCGHGIADGNLGAIISWLFSDSLLNKYRVVSDGFYSELQYHGVERLTLITDTCRDAPPSLDLMRLDPSRGIVVHGSKVDSPNFDRLAASQDGQKGYMIFEPNSAQPGKCIFSGVVADVLWGQEPEAIKDGVITIGSFRDCVSSRTVTRAKDYHLKLNPQCFAGPGSVVLYDAANKPKGEPQLQPWPKAGSPVFMGPPPAPLGLEVGLESRMVLARHPGAAVDVGRMSGDIETHARKNSVRGVQRSLTSIRSETSDLIVADPDATIWAREPIERRRRTASRAGFRIPKSMPPGTPLLVEYADGSFIPVVPYADLRVLVKRDPSGEVLQAYEERDSRGTFLKALQAIADFAAGRLSADSVGELAAQMRHDKHVDPILGVISAYLYRAVSDFDSIRRMAYYYASKNQPVPYDLALLGEMKVSRDARRELVLRIPGVRAREPRTGTGNRRRKTSDLPQFVTAATRARNARIGGLCPWLALGWDYVGMARPEWAVLVGELREYASEVPRRGFTVLSPDIGRKLARRWKLKRSQSD